MNDEQYAMLVLQLSAFAQMPDALTPLDDEMVENLVFLLAEAKRVAMKEDERRRNARRDQLEKQDSFLT